MATATKGKKAGKKARPELSKAERERLFHEVRTDMKKAVGEYTQSIADRDRAKANRCEALASLGEIADGLRREGVSTKDIEKWAMSEPYKIAPSTMRLGRTLSKYWDKVPATRRTTVRSAREWITDYRQRVENYKPRPKGDGSKKTTTEAVAAVLSLHGIKCKPDDFVLAVNAFLVDHMTRKQRLAWVIEEKKKGA